MTLLEQVTTGGLAIAIFGVAMAYAKKVLSFLSQFIFEEHLLENDLVLHVTNYLGDPKRSRKLTPLRVLKTRFGHVKPLGINSWVVVEENSIRTGDIILYRPNGGFGVPLYYDGESYSFYSIRGTVDWDELTRLAIEWRRSINEEVTFDGCRFHVVKHTGRQGESALLEGMASLNRDDDDAPSPKNNIITTSMVSDMKLNAERPLHYEFDELGESNEKTGLNNLSLTPELLEVIEEIKFWKEDWDWYRERGVPWRRGYGLEGRPGTGKTSFVRGVAEQLDLPIHAVYLATMNDRELLEAWGKIREATPCVVLLEDLDTVFKGRENITDSSLTFDCLLNCVDGAERAHGVLLFITTNHIEDLDPAIGGPAGDEEDDIPDRPGRIDRVVHFAAMDRAGREKMARRILKDLPHEVDHQVALGANDTPAKFQERCFRVALAHKWSTDRKKATSSAS